MALCILWIINLQVTIWISFSFLSFSLQSSVLCPLHQRWLLYWLKIWTCRLSNCRNAYRIWWFDSKENCLELTLRQNKYYQKYFFRDDLIYTFPFVHSLPTRAQFIVLLIFLHFSQQSVITMIQFRLMNNQV